MPIHQSGAGLTKKDYRVGHVPILLILHGVMRGAESLDSSTAMEIAFIDGPVDIIVALPEPPKRLFALNDSLLRRQL